ncbi:ArsR/SmtB family transcription factor [Paenibacillus beijingensis]|uniref:TrmB family transcriptional regulator n=1 Tax=Paenibacillus beijingensis TaxID=1126833 RepID=A0A0D5NF27_9BACL|nr:metalloregulator ArsR/SmtB family transcription factor [Paenibacillus beijingensis]AJY73523.1 TrmB family transcriptional regulator [Paenibacillus beijingensis]
MITTTLSALAEPIRFHIVEMLRDGPRPVGEIAERLQLHQPKVSKHLRVLSDAGLVDVQPVAQMRIYKLRPQSFNELDTWLQSFRLIWDERLNQLDDYLQQMQEKEKNQME